jgi:anti-anti-sigma factor
VDDHESQAASRDGVLLFLDVTELGGGGRQLVVGGEIDVATSDEFGAAIERAMSGAPRVELDLGGVTFLDSSGLRALVAAYQGRQDDQELLIVEASDAVRRVLDITDLLGLFGLS